MAHPRTLHTDARLGREPSQALQDHVVQPRLDLDLAMFDEYLQVDKAHVVMLVTGELIPAEVGRQLLDALVGIEARGAAGLDIDVRRGTLLFQIEHELERTIGAHDAGFLHLARSQIDQGAAFHRVYSRNRLLELLHRLHHWQQTLLERAGDEADTLMPGYTHLQHAQPTTFGHYLHAQAAATARDVERILATYRRTNLGALGTVALSGTSWPVDRELTAELLGHDGTLANARDAGFFAMDVVFEIAASLAILLGGLGRLASDLDVWGTHEFGLVELDERLCGTSSNMPQKKNHYVLERIRAIAGEASGWLGTQLAVGKMPSSTSCDMAFVSGELPSYFQRTGSAVLLADEVVATLRIDRDRMARLAGANWSTASHLTDEIVRHCGLDFRSAHALVAAIVRRSLADGLDADALTDDAVADLFERHGVAPEQRRQLDLAVALDPGEFVRTRSSPGGAAPTEVRAMIEASHGDLEGQAQAITAEQARLDRAAERLEAAVASIRAA